MGTRALHSWPHGLFATQGRTKIIFRLRRRNDYVDWVVFADVQCTNFAV